jgi:hypothetical protein
MAEKPAIVGRADLQMRAWGFAMIPRNPTVERP